MTLCGQAGQPRLLLCIEIIIWPMAMSFTVLLGIVTAVLKD